MPVSELVGVFMRILSKTRYRSPECWNRRWLNGVGRKWGRTDLTKDFTFPALSGHGVYFQKTHDLNRFGPDLNRIPWNLVQNCQPLVSADPNLPGTDRKKGVEFNKGRKKQ